MNMKKIVASAAALSLTAAVAVGGTLAWLQAESHTVTNTFTVGNVALTLTEEEGTLTSGESPDQTREFEVSPGTSVAKDPKITVTGGSDACYVFVQVTETNNDNDEIVWSVRDGWDQVPGTTNVWYRTVGENAADQSFYILTAGDGEGLENGAVTISEDVSGTINATLAFKGYAIQSAGIEAKDGKTAPQVAWETVSAEG